MKYIRYIKCDLMEILCSPVFWVCCLIVTGLEFTTDFYLVGPEKSYTVIGTWLNVPHNKLVQNPDFSSISAFLDGMGTWMLLFVPIIVSLPCIVIYRDESSTGFRRFRLASAGKNKYIVTKIISGYMIGGSILVIGSLLYGVIVAIMFPLPGVYDQSDIQMFLEYKGYSSIIQAVLSYLGIVFLYGGFWCTLSLCLCSFIHNKYVVVGIPFMFKYVWDELCYKYSSDYGPDRFVNNYGYETEEYIIYYIYLTLFAALVIVFYLLNVRKVDLGE